MSKITSKTYPINPVDGDAYVFTDVLYDSYDLTLLTDDDVIVAGAFDNDSTNNLVKYSWGTFYASVDTTFKTNIGVGASGTVKAVSSNSSDHIFFGGLFSAFNSISTGRFYALNSDGTALASFMTNVGTAFNNDINTVIVDSNDKVLVGGLFTTFNGSTRNYIVRLNSDGTVDTAFTANLGLGFNNSITKIKIQADGKILVMGNFTTLNGTITNRFARLNSDGSPDTTFNTALGTGFSQTVNDCTILSDNSLIIVGDYVSFNGNFRQYVVKVSSTGTEDTAFYTNLGTGFGNTVTSIASDLLNTLYIVGSFTSYDGNSVDNYAVIQLDGTLYDFEGLEYYIASPRAVKFINNTNRIYWLGEGV